MAPRKRSRQETSLATAEVPTTRILIDETHAVQLARHLAELYKLPSMSTARAYWRIALRWLARCELAEAELWAV